MYTAGIPQQMYQNQMQQAAGRAGAMTDEAKIMAQQSQAGMGALGSAAIAGATIYAASDVRAKKNVELAPEEIDDFLSNLTGYKYSYKDPERYGKGERIGVMAQDMNKSNLGKEAVVKDEEGMMGIDGSKALSAILASLGQLNDKINALENKNGR
jgi:hypothetical protein